MGKTSWIDQTMSLWGEIRRRNVHRVAIAYVAAAWLLIQVVETIAPLFGFGTGPAQVIVIVLAFGFAPVLVLSWVFEWTPEGFQREEDVSAETRRTNTAALHRAITVLLVLAVAYFAADKFWFRVPPVDANRSIAVLPFENLSSDPEQEYFSDGISEELLNLLTKIDGLRVISRTSSFQFKETELSIPEIARRLDVVHVLEGSVRRSGDQIRITAQLIDARTDEHLWSETYDRKFEDVFAIQDEVAAKVTEELKFAIDVGLDPVERHDPVAYALKMRAEYLLKLNDPSAIDTAEQLLMQVLEIEPDYIDAQFNLHNAYVRRIREAERELDKDTVREYSQRRDTLFQELVAAAPENTKVNTILAWEAAMYDAEYQKAAVHIEKAIESEPTNYYSLLPATYLAMQLGRPHIAIAVGKYLTSRDPLGFWAHSNLGDAYLSVGQVEDAIRSYRTAASITPNASNIHWKLGIALLVNGQAAEALETFDQETMIYFRSHGRAMALYDLGDADGYSRAFSTLQEATGIEIWPHGYARLHAWTGDADKAFPLLYRTRDETPADFSEIELDPLLQKLHDDPRWQPLMDEVAAQTGNVEFNPKFPSEIFAEMP